QPPVPGGRGRGELRLAAQRGVDVEIDAIERERAREAGRIGVVECVPVEREALVLADQQVEARACDRFVVAREVDAAAADAIALHVEAKSGIGAVAAYP